MAAYDRSTILPCQLEPTSTVANGESDTTNSYYSSDSDPSAAMSTENVVDVRAGNTDWCKCHCCATAQPQPTESDTVKWQVTATVILIVRPDEYVCCQGKRVWQIHAVHDAKGKIFTVRHAVSSFVYFLIILTSPIIMLWLEWRVWLGPGLG